MGTHAANGVWFRAGAEGCVCERERDLMDVLFCLALDGYLAGTGEVGDGGQEVLKADGWFFTPTFSPTLTNSCTSDRVRICP